MINKTNLIWKKRVKQTLLVSSLFLVLPISATAEVGEELHTEKCMSCHQTDAYTRENRVVKSKHQLGKQVSMCTQNLNINWFPDDEKAVVDFMNASYYHFK